MFDFSIAFIIALVTLFVYLSNLSNQRHHANSIRYIKKQRDIANFQILGQNNVQATLRARAIPNQRLATAFGIFNSFTTDDPAVHSEFLQRAKAGIFKMGPKEHVEFLNAAKISLDRIVEFLDPDGQRPLPLARLVRAFVLIATLNKFFDMDPSFVDVNVAIHASETINRLWSLSKFPEQLAQSQDPRLLQTYLERLLPGQFPCEPKDHPINIIIPAYETMWRVVLLTFVAAGFQCQDKAASREFQEVVDEISKFPGQGGEFYRKVAVGYAKEGLRLYPPTRRIFRAVPCTEGNPEVVFANIEKCHRDKNIWGRDVLQFRPSRWRTVTQDMSGAYMPFGNGGHACPTAGGFGYRAIMIFVAALAQRLGTQESGSRVEFGDLVQDSQTRHFLGAPLPYGRQQLEGWKLEMAARS